MRHINRGGSIIKKKVCPLCEADLIYKNNGWVFCPNSASRRKEHRCKFETFPVEKKEANIPIAPLMPPHKPINSGDWDTKRERRYPWNIRPPTEEKAMARYAVDLERYRRKMKQRGLKPVV